MKNESLTGQSMSYFTITYSWGVVISRTFLLFNRLWLNLHLRSHCQKSRWHPSLPSPAPLNRVSCPSPLGKCQSWWGHLRGDNDKKHGCHYNDSDFKCTLCVSRMIASKNSLYYKVKKKSFWLLTDNIQQCFSRNFVGRGNSILGKGMCPQNTLVYVNLCRNSAEHFSVFKESQKREQRYYHGCRVIYVAAQVFFKTLNVTAEALSLLCADLNDPGDI